ncbi:hypothetical protein ACIKTA_12240, partial [Hansschlegelia beijingensis]
SPEALARIDAYMKQGGTILFDTRDALTSGPSRNTTRLSTMAAIAASVSSHGAIGVGSSVAICATDIFRPARRSWR